MSGRVRGRVGLGLELGLELGRGLEVLRLDLDTVHHDL